MVLQTLFTIRNNKQFAIKESCISVFSEAATRIAGQACNFIKKETLAQVFSCEFCKISKNTFFTEHLPTTASVFYALFVFGNYFAQYGLRLYFLT